MAAASEPIAVNTGPLIALSTCSGLDLLGALHGRVVVPDAVAAELDAGRAKGLNLPQVEALDWVVVRVPAGASVLPLVSDLGAGEKQVLITVTDAQGKRPPAMLPRRMPTACVGNPYGAGADSLPAVRGTPPLSFSAAAVPAQARIDAQTGAVSWTPQASQQGEQTYEVSLYEQLHHRQGTARAPA